MKTRSRPENEKPRNEKMNPSFNLKSPMNQQAIVRHLLSSIFNICPCLHDWNNVQSFLERQSKEIFSTSCSWEVEEKKMSMAVDSTVLSNTQFFLQSGIHISGLCLKWIDLLHIHLCYITYLILDTCSETLHPELHQPLSTRSSIISRAKLSLGIQAKASLTSSCKGFTLKVA